MKIIIAAPAWPYRGGIAEFSNRLAMQLISEGHDTSIKTFKLQYPAILFPGKSQYSEAPAPEGIEITREMNSVNPFNWIRKGLKIKREKPEILLLRFWLPFMGPGLGTISRIVRRNRHTKVICIFDNVVPHEKRPGDRILTKYLTNSIDGAIVMSGTVRDELSLFRKDLPVRLNPHPLFDTYGTPVSREDALKKLGLEQEFNYLLFFGFVRAYKGLDLLLEAFADTRLRNRKLKLIVAGEFYEDRAPYDHLIKKNHLEDDVILYNRFIRNDEVPLFFSASDLVVQPYRSATQSGVTQIAFQYGKPMLVTDVGGLREIVNDRISGYVVEPLPSKITEAVLDYFDHNREDSLAEGVREKKKEFSWNKLTGAIMDLYGEL